MFGAVVDEPEEREQPRPRTEAVSEAFTARAAGGAVEVREQSGQTVALVVNGQTAWE